MLCLYHAIILEILDVPDVITVVMLKNLDCV